MPALQVLDYTAQLCDTDVDSASRIMSKMERRAREVEASSSSSLPPPPPPATMPSATIKVRVLNDPNIIDGSNVIGDNGSSLLYLDRLEVSEGDGPVDSTIGQFAIDRLQGTDTRLIEFNDVVTGKVDEVSIGILSVPVSTRWSWV